MIDKKYRVILADPPWDFRVWNKDTGSGRSPCAHYNTMSIDDICHLPIQEIIHKDCVLFLWSVWPSMMDSYSQSGKLISPSYPSMVMRAWGFTYKTKAFTWIKAKKSGPGFFMGMGYYTRSNDEVCLLATRGNMPVAVHDELSVIYSPVRKHSQKPDEQYRKIERLYPNGPYLELFSRHKRQGWDVFGEEVDGSIELVPTVGEAT